MRLLSQHEMGRLLPAETHAFPGPIPAQIALVHPAYERMIKAGIVNVCMHKGLFLPSLDRTYPYRFPGGGDPADALAQFDRTGRGDWVTDLAGGLARSGQRPPDGTHTQV